jgi:hypothetical protein
VLDLGTSGVWRWGMTDVFEQMGMVGVQGLRG